MIVDALKMLKIVMDNPLSRIVLRMGLKNYHDSHMKKMEHALATFTGEDTSHKISNHIYSLMMSAILMVSGSLFGVDLEKLKGYFKDPIVRRGVVSLLSGIGRYGVTKPQFLDTPFLVVWNYTNACNLRYQHCYQRADMPTPNELTTREKIRVVSDLAEAGVVSIAFSGGGASHEPRLLQGGCRGEEEWNVCCSSYKWDADNPKGDGKAKGMRCGLYRSKLRCSNFYGS